MNRNVFIILIALLLIIFALILFPRATAQNPTMSPSPTASEVKDVQPTEDTEPTTESKQTAPTLVPTSTEASPTNTPAP